GLVFAGPTGRTLTINVATNAYGTPLSRVLHHTGTGDVTIQHLRLLGGKYASSSANADGGCIYSKGSVVLISAVVTGCTVATSKPSDNLVFARGGAIYAKGTVFLGHSEVQGNSALALYKTNAIGAGVLADSLYSYYSTISGNNATSVTSGYS